MSFVISNSFYQSLPITGFLRRMGVIPKQQFQTTVSDMKEMKAVVDAGQPLVIYPAGLMCEDGLSTPIPGATYKFLKWLGVDVYVARISGTYFAMPKWGKGFRPGKTTLDVYKLICAEDLAAMDVERVHTLVDQALCYDAYREQEQLQVRYSSNIEGLENVLYLCPNCGQEHTMAVRNGDTIFCTACGYAQRSDAYGFLHNDDGFGPRIRYVSDWSKMVYAKTESMVRSGALTELGADCAIHMIDPAKHKFLPVGEGRLTLASDGFCIAGTIADEAVQLNISADGLPTLPFSPGKYLEVQDGKTIYRCVLQDGKLVMKFINLVKIRYQQKLAAVREKV